MTLSRYRRDAEHFAVVTPFEYGGRDFAEGEAFPWREFDLGEYGRRQLWMANKIRVVDAPAAVTPEPTTPPPAPSDEPDEPDPDAADDPPRRRRRRPEA